MDIYRPKDWKCPICENKMEQLSIYGSYKYSCKSGCYCVSEERGDAEDRIYFITIFNSKIKIRKYMVFQHKQLLEKSVIDRINYWKKDYRYVAEILINM